MDRTEEQKIAHAPIKVVLGGKEYEIKPLVIRDSRIWRAKVSELLASLPQYAKITTDTPDEFGKALSALLVAMPDRVVDLFFDYAKDLNREEIEAVSTDQEIADAFDKVVSLAFPLAKSLVGAMAKLSQ